VEKPLPPHEAVPKFSENFVHGNDRPFFKKRSKDRGRNRRRIRGGMDDVGFFRKGPSGFSKRVPHEIEAPGTHPVNLDVCAHRLVGGHVGVMPASEDLDFMPLSGEPFDDVAEERFGSSHVGNVIIEDEEDFHGTGTIAPILSKAGRFQNF
jgi:hypothetical protein